MPLIRHSMCACSCQGCLQFLVGKCSFPCRSSDSRSLWRTQLLLSVSFFFLLLSLSFSCTFSRRSTFPPPPPPPPSVLSLSPPLLVMPVVSNYHGSVFPQPLHYIQAVITVYLRHLLPLLTARFNRNYLSQMTRMRRLDARSINSPFKRLRVSVLMLKWLKNGLFVSSILHFWFLTSHSQIQKHSWNT